MFGNILHTFRRYDWLLTIVVFILVSIGLAAIYSVDLSKGSSLIYFPKQLFALCLGSVILFTFGALHKTRYESVARFSYIVGLVLLVAVLFFGQEIRGTTGWFRFGGFSFQPAEFAKLTLVLLLGWWISKQGRRFDTWEFVASSTIATGLYVGLIMLQPDLGSASILLGIWFGLLLLTGIKKRYIFSFLLIGVCAAVFAWFFLLQGYQKERLATFMDPQRDPLGSGYNVTQSIIAIGSGGFFGRGLGFGSQSQLHFLPEAQTDFIIAVIGEELGFVGLSSVFVLYTILIWRLIHIASIVKDDFSSYTILGVALIFLIQVCINVGGATGLLPVTGVTLPFVSYGGSSLMMNFFLLSITISINASHKKIYQ
ncbi:MAG: rod shape-determining protein RodA [Candidatus Magasanikbacteria bacterium]|nr:rod shape-determining protein RodA [Candidatus Magasanikbacteria bacterium]|tara:strand:+ start:828 stop:1934 length:1107 start_codon:yes stop_codon:yes gene_type:complete